MTLQGYGNPHYGYVSFDNFGSMFLLLFQVIRAAACYFVWVDYWPPLTMAIVDDGNCCLRDTPSCTSCVAKNSVVHQ